MGTPTSKSSIEDLAIFGGTPAFDHPLHVNRPNMGSREIFDRLVDGIWDRRWFTNDGPLVQQLEQALQLRLGVKHCVLMSSGTAALSVLVNAMQLNGEVILPSFTFVSTPHVLQWVGIEPVFCDIDSRSWNLDLEHCESLITERTTAIIATHLWGRPCDVEQLGQLADRRGIRLIFDAAHAFGCTYQGRPIGGFGDAEVFSFQANKIFHTGEGGAVTTNDDQLAQRLRTIRNFGFTDFDRVDLLGTNAKLPEMSAAIGLTNLETVDELMKTSQQTYQLYQDRLQGLEEIKLNQYDPQERNNYHYVTLLVAASCALSRDDLIQIFRAENVLARRYFFPGCHRMEPYRSRLPSVHACLPVTNRIAEHVLVLPGGASISDDDVRETAELFRFVLKHATEIRSNLEKMAACATPVHGRHGKSVA